MASTSSIGHHQEIGQQILETRLTIEDEEKEAAADHEELAASLTKKLEVEYRLIPSSCCIFKAPHKLRVVNEKSFIPKAVSIGPYHYHRKKLEQYETTEKYKFHFLKQFLKRRRPSKTFQACVKDCVRMLKSHEKTARECYADDITLTSEEFVEMMMLDGCFIVELFLRNRNQLHGEYDPLFDHRYLLNMIFEDLLLLENQLPFFVLRALFDFINNACQLPNLWEISFLELALEFFGHNEEDACTLEEPSHLLDLKYKTSIPSQRTNEGDGGDGDGDGKSRDGGRSPSTIPTATQLWEAGVKFRAAPRGTHFLDDIKFENGTLKIPTIIVEDETEHCFRNMIAYEQWYDERSCVVDYFTVIDDLINSPSDVALLKRKGIIVNWLGDDEEVSNLVNKMIKNVYASSGAGFQYKDLYKKLNDYYQTRCNKRKAKLKHDYFNSPWSLVAFLAAFAVLICTFIQTVCSIIQTVK